MVFKLSESFTLDEWWWWLNLNRRPYESLLDTSERLVVAAAFFRRPPPRRTLEQASLDLHLRQATTGGRRATVSRLASRHGIEWLTWHRGQRT